MFSLLIGTTSFADADDHCSTSDKNFVTFIDRFKNDKAFQKSRIIYPLQLSSTQPDANGKMAREIKKLTLKEINDQSILIIRGRSEAAELMGGEGQLCEQGPSIKGETASLIQHSCHTDVYGYTYNFVLKEGCWFLQDFSLSQS
jgi:hypothetical protein